MPSYTIEFDRNFDRTLRELVRTTGATTKADVIRRAVASYSYLKKQQQASRNAKIFVIDDARPRKEIVLP